MITKEEKIVHHFKSLNELMVEKKTPKMRKLVISDLFSATNVSVKYDYRYKKGDRVKRYRQQQEYGEKKKIKP